MLPLLTSLIDTIVYCVLIAKISLLQNFGFDVKLSENSNVSDYTKFTPGASYRM